MRKTIIIIVIILCVIAIAVGVYFGWKNAQIILNPSAPASQQPISIQISTSTTPNEATNKKLEVVSDQPIFGYWIFSGATSSEAGVFYLGTDGKIFQVKGDGKDEAITSEPILNVQAIKSSSDGSRVIIEYGDLNTPKFVIFNTAAKIFELLPDDISAADFSPDAKKIAYLETPTSTALSNLTIKDLVGSKSKTTKILSFNQKDFDLQWISPEKIILTPKPSAFYSSSAWLVDIKNKTLTSLASEINGLIIKYSASGKIGLQFSSQSYGTVGKLNLINDLGAIKANLDFMTLPEKCLVSEPQIYCAIPKNIPTKTVLPDDYLKKAVYFSDLFYQIDITQNSSLEIFAPTNSAIDAVDLKLIDGKLLFINRYDNKLYGLEL